MSIWQRFIDSIFDSPFGKVSPAEDTQARSRGTAINWTDQELDDLIESHTRMARDAKHGKVWTLGAGNTLHLTDFPITIKRVEADQQMTFGGRFRVDCDGLTPSFAWTLEDAKFVGERWAREIDALPLIPEQTAKDDHMSHSRNNNTSHP